MTNSEYSLKVYQPGESNGRLPFRFDDGGRAAAGWGASKRDCVARAIAIATEQPYAVVHAALSEINVPRRRRLQGAKSAESADHGVYRSVAKRYLLALGWKFTPTMGIGTGCRVHLRAPELPAGRLVVVVSRHYTAVIDGVIHDTHDPARAGTRCVYGYWGKP